MNWRENDQLLGSSFGELKFMEDRDDALWFVTKTGRKVALEPQLVAENLVSLKCWKVPAERAGK